MNTNNTPLDSDTIFVRRFRWTLISENTMESTDKLSNDLCSKPPVTRITMDGKQLKGVTIDWKNKKLLVQFYEIVEHGKDSPMWAWLDTLQGQSHETLLFTTFDGVGNEIYRLAFTGLEYEDMQETNFDYEISDPVIPVAVIKFEKCSREFVY